VCIWGGLINRWIEEERLQGNIGANFDVMVTEVWLLKNSRLVKADNELLRLCCNVSGLEIDRSTDSEEVIGASISKHTGHKCPRCWRYYEALVASGLCVRCDGAVSAGAAHG
jgi:isoleucyl-tRNA synthetase